MKEERLDDLVDIGKRFLDDAIIVQKYSLNMKKGGVIDSGLWSRGFHNLQFIIRNMDCKNFTGERLLKRVECYRELLNRPLSSMVRGELINLIREAVYMKELATSYERINGALDFL